MASRLPIKVGAAVVAVLLSAAACSSAAANDAPSNHTTSSAADPTSTQAATLRAGLDLLFHEHVDLTGFVVQTAVGSGIDSPATGAALKTLDDNTVALGDAIGSIYGADAKTAFLKLWRAHIGFFVEYTKGLATGDSSMVSEAQRRLANYKQDFAKFLGNATQIPPAAIATELQGHIQTLEAAIQAIVTKSPTAAGKLQMAAMHMDGTAAALAGGISAEKNFTGDANGDASTLRSTLTGLLEQHVAQTAVVVQTAVQDGLPARQTAAAVNALDDNTVALSDAIGSVYGADAKTAFLKMWRAHIGFFVDYTKGLATGNSQLVRSSQSKLAGYKRDFSKFLGSATGLPAAAVAQDLQGHITTLEAAIKAIVTKSPAAADKVSMAESHMAGTAAALAKAIAAQQHLS